MKLPIYQVDAFTSSLFGGNPAAVCPLDQWLPDEVLQKIALENNLSETVFYVKDGDKYLIRWFTPTVEVDLCGHATLAAAYVLYTIVEYSSAQIHFYSHRSGDLIVTKDGNYITLNFPTDVYHQLSDFAGIEHCFSVTPTEIWKGKTDLMLVFENEDIIKNIHPNFEKISNLPVRGVIVTAPGVKSDFVSRFFGPQSGINEDPVTGSAHTTLIPYWANRLKNNHLHAIQMSDRQGILKCQYLGERVAISGEAVLYMEGSIILP